jgi:hypothetical protein
LLPQSMLLVLRAEIWLTIVRRGPASS